MPDTRIAGTTPEEAGARNAPQEGRISALESRINTLLTGIEKEKRSAEEEKQKQKPEDKPITFGGVQTALDKLMKSIAMALNRVSSSIDGKIRDIGKIYATQDQAKEFAKDAVPPMLRGLGTSGGAEPSTGNVIMVQPGGEGGQDSVYVGTVAAGGINLTGTVALPHIVWNATTENWTINIIVPDGTAALPHLVWNETTEKWEIDVIVPDGSVASPHLVWDGSKWGVGEISGLPEGGIDYQVLQKQSGVAVWDWTRWVVVH